MMKYIYTVVCLLMTTALIAQSTVSGRVLDESTNEPLIGASVVVKGTTTGTVTDYGGRFAFEVPEGDHQLVISYVGYEPEVMEIEVTGEDLVLGDIIMDVSMVGLQEVDVIASVAIDRKTPVAVSTLKGDQIENLVGNQEYPEVLETTPSVYVTRQGGGYGDARINVRGFDQRNTAVLVNGIPVNDMENGWVYWSNWAGLADVTRTVQVQRGLGASKLAIPSVGGTINIITRTTDQQEGGSVFSSVGNDGYRKFGMTVSTGKTENDWAFTFSGSRTTGNGYIEGTYIDAWSYFASISKDINKQHQLQFTAIGAPQRHGQRDFEHSIGGLLDHYGIRYNDDFGYKNGEPYLMEENFYHKPQLALNHYWTINRDAFLATSAYYSTGRGGGTGALGGVDGLPIFLQNTDSYGHIQWDEITKWNTGQPNTLADNSNSRYYYETSDGQSGNAFIANSTDTAGMIKRASMNEHNWAGILSTVNWDITDQLTLVGGIDGRYYKGLHYRKTLDLLGNDYWFERGNVNQKEDWVDLNGDGEQSADEMGALIRPNGQVKDRLWGRPGEDQRIAYDNDGVVKWIGTFGQLEYSNEAGLSIFAAGSVSNKSYKRVERFLEPEGDQETDLFNFIGGSAKAGANYNINDVHNVYGNLGYYSNQPTFDNVFTQFNNVDINEDAENEKVIGYELGYGYRGERFSANLNLYRTSWMDKSFYTRYVNANGQERYANLKGIDAVHQGIELDFNARLFRRLSLNGMASINDWYWANNVETDVFDEIDNSLVETIQVYAEDIKVGDAAQTSFSIGANLDLGSGISVDGRYSYFADLYAEFAVEDRVDVVLKGIQALELPEYGIADLGLTYQFELFDFDAKLRANVNNLFNEKYVSEAVDNTNPDDYDDDSENNEYRQEDGSIDYDAQLKDARGWYGFGTTWNVTFKLSF